MKRYRVHAHLIGTQVQEKGGSVKVKVEGIDGAKWMRRGRFNYMKAHKVELEENQRVYHMNGDKADDDPANLVAITFSGKAYNLVTSRVVYRPPQPIKSTPMFNKEKQLAIA